MKQIIICSLLFFLFIAAVVSPDGHLGDLLLFYKWGKHIDDWGLGNVYFSNANYPPGYYYILKFHEIVFGYETSIEFFIKHIKLYSLLFDLAGIGLILHALNDRKNLFFHWILMAMNIAYLYNSIIWGQVDAIASTLNFAAILFAYKNKWIVAAILFVISINVKLQSVIYFPLLLLLFILNYKKQQALSNWKTLLTLVATQVIILIPYLHKGKLLQIQEVVTGAVGFFPFVSMNAANIWHLLLPCESLTQLNDQTISTGLSYKTWGIILFLTSMVIAMIPFMQKIFQHIFQKTNFSFTFDQILLIGALIPLLFFFFFTEMHERYSHNAWLFITAWSFRNKQYMPYFLFSIAYFLNMESILGLIHTKNSVIYDLRFIALIFAAIIVYLIRQLHLKESIFSRLLAKN